MKKIMLFVLLLMCANLVLALDYSKTVPPNSTINEEVTIVHNITNITNMRDITITGKMPDGFRLSHWWVEGYALNSTDHILNGENHKWIITPNSTSVLFTITLIAPNTTGNYSAESLASFSPGNFKKVTSVINVINGCGKNVTIPCWSGDVVTLECLRGNLYDTNGTCREKECDKDETRACENSSVIVTTRECKNFTYVPTKEVCPVVDCTEDLIKTCDDGSKITEKACVKAKYVETGKACVPHKDTFFLQIVLILLLVVLVIVYKRNKDGKKDEDSDN